MLAALMLAAAIAAAYAPLKDKDGYKLKADRNPC